jgi:hypothetical protein
MHLAAIRRSTYSGAAFFVGRDSSYYFPIGHHIVYSICLLNVLHCCEPFGVKMRPHLLFLLVSFFATSLFSQDASKGEMFLYYPDAKLFHSRSAIIPNQNSYYADLYPDEALMIVAGTVWKDSFNAELGLGLYGQADQYHARGMVKVYNAERVFIAASGYYQSITHNPPPVDAVLGPIPDAPYAAPPDTLEQTMMLALHASYLITRDILVSVNSGIMQHKYLVTDFPLTFTTGLIYRPIPFVQLKTEYTFYSIQRGALRNHMYAGLSLISRIGSIEVGYISIKNKRSGGLQEGFVAGVSLYY